MMRYCTFVSFRDFFVLIFILALCFLTQCSSVAIDSTETITTGADSSQDGNDADESQSNERLSNLKRLENYFKKEKGSLKYYDSQLHTYRLFGNVSIGYYYINLFVGTPPQEQTVIVDTGSHITAFPCSECTSCGEHIDPAFKVESSSTLRRITCNDQLGNFKCTSCSNDNKCKFSIGYTEGSSLEGVLMEDYVVMGDEIQEYYENKTHRVNDNPILAKFIENFKTKFVFGCTQKETNLFYTQKANGIMGLGVKTNSTDIIPNIIDYTFRDHHHDKEEKSFSLCYAKDGGYLTIGGYNSKNHVPKAKPIILSYADKSQYNIEFTQIYVNGESLKIEPHYFKSGQGTFLDSGTTEIYLNSDLFSNLNSKLQKFIKFRNYMSPEKGQTVKEFLNSFPNVTFEFEHKHKVVLTAEEYLVNENQIWRLGINEFSDRNILGGLFFQNLDILFDRNNRKIHMTRANCTEDYVWFDKKNADDRNYSKASEETSDTEQNNGTETENTESLKPNATDSNATDFISAIMSLKALYRDAGQYTMTVYFTLAMILMVVIGLILFCVRYIRALRRRKYLVASVGSASSIDGGASVSLEKEETDEDDSI